MFEAASPSVSLFFGAQDPRTQETQVCRPPEAPGFVFTISVGTPYPHARRARLSAAWTPVGRRFFKQMHLKNAKFSSDRALRARRRPTGARLRHALCTHARIPLLKPGTDPPHTTHRSRADDPTHSLCQHSAAPPPWDGRYTRSTSDCDRRGRKRRGPHSSRNSHCSQHIMIGP